MKKPVLSIIITTYNNADVLDKCLSSIKKQEFKDYEIIVVDESSKDGTKEIALKYSDKFINQGLERCQKRNIGAKNSNSDFLFFVDSDMVFSKSILKEIYQKINQNTLLMVPEISFGEGFWAKSKSFERSFYKGGDLSQGVRVYPKRIFFDANGFDESMIGVEDLDLFHRIKKMNKKIKVQELKSNLFHNEGNLKYFQIIKRMLYYSKSFSKYKKRHPEIFKKQLSVFKYLNKWTNFIKHPLLSFGFILIKGGEATAVFYSLIKNHN